MNENILNSDEVVDMNPDLLKPVEKTNAMKEWLVDYVGTKCNPENDEVNVEMILKVMAEEFPEFLMPLAEENFIRGYKQALEDVEEGEKMMKREGLIT